LSCARQLQPQLPRTAFTDLDAPVCHVTLGVTTMLIPPLEWSAVLLGNRPSGLCCRARIDVRRFAGPAAYVGQMTPLRIAHLTDLHVGRVTPYLVQREAVSLTNGQQPDLVVITGDFVCHSQLYLDQLSEIMRSFTAPVVAVL